jgi:hypothetical protein
MIPLLVGWYFIGLILIGWSKPRELLWCATGVATGILMVKYGVV